MPVLVTGGAGFIGANLCRRLAQTDVGTVVAYDNLSTGSAANLARTPATRLIEADVGDTRALARAVKGVDAVIHLAARPSVARSVSDPVASHETNATGTLVVLEAARQAGGHAHVVLASSSSVYGTNPVLPKSESLVPEPRSPYAASKLAAEAYALAYAETFGLAVTVFRFFNVYGPLQPAGHAYAAVIPAFVAAALDDEPLPVHGDGNQTRDFTYVGSVCEVLAATIVDRVVHPKPMNLAFETRTSLHQLIAELEACVGRPLEREHLPTRAGDIRDSQADNRLLRTTFPQVEPVPLSDGLAATVRWFQEEVGAG